MPLVPIKVIEEWYFKDSWVFKNFEYIYQNQLWHKQVPKGRSVCVYFWSSIIVGTFIRFLVGLCLFVGWLVKLARLGRAVSWADTKVVNLLRRLLRNANAYGETPHGFSILVFIATVVVVVGVAGLGWQLWSIAVFAWHACLKVGALAGDPLPRLGVLPQVAGSVILAAVFVPSLIYTMVPSAVMRDHRCPVEWYVRAMLVLTLTTGLVLRHAEAASLCHSLQATGPDIWRGIASVGKFLWWIVVGAGHYLAVSFTWTGAEIKALFLGVVKAVLWVGVGIVAALAVAGQLINRTPTVPTTPPPLSEEELLKEQMRIIIDRSPSYSDAWHISPTKSSTSQRNTWPRLTPT